jgi:hypothetical protein
MMDSDISSLPDDVADLKDITISPPACQEDLQNKYQSRIANLEERIELLQNELFGRKTEKLPKEDRSQLLLFNEADSEKEAIEAGLLDEIMIAQHTDKK